jgi:hypothetical protein
VKTRHTHTHTSIQGKLNNRRNKNSQKKRKENKTISKCGRKGNNITTVVERIDVVTIILYFPIDREKVSEVLIELSSARQHCGSFVLKGFLT